MTRGCSSLLLVLVGILGMAAPASAHSELRSSTPTLGASLDKAPQQVVLIFSDDVDTRFTNLILTAGDGQTRRLTAEVQDNQVSASIDPATAKLAGRWSVGYRVVSADGHPITGVVTFTVQPPASTPAVAPTPAVTPAPAATSTLPATTVAALPRSREDTTSTAGLGSPSTAWALTGFMVLMLVSGAAVWRARRKTTR